MELQAYLHQILGELQATLVKVSNQTAEHCVTELLRSKRVFIAGARRSHLALKGFAMRLMHLGFEFHVVIGSTIILLTIREDSPLAQLADMTLIIPAPGSKMECGTGGYSVQPMGSLFEQSLALTLDALVLMLMDRVAVDAHAMWTRHANLE